MGGRELQALQQQVRLARQVREANERRWALLLQRRRPRGMGVVVASLGSVATWMRRNPVDVGMLSVVAVVGTAGLIGLAAVTDDEPWRPPIAALPETGQAAPAGTVTVTLSTVGNEKDGESGVEPDGEPAAEPDGEPAGEPDGEPAGEPDGEPAAESDPSVVAPSRDQEQPVTADPAREPVSSAGPVASSPAPVPEPEPELADTGESDDAPVTEPEPADPSDPADPADPADPESPDDDEPDEDDAADSCVGVNALGLTVNLCVPSLLGG